jgi:hypothetical protein
MACENGLPSTGVPYVGVHGTIVVKDSKVMSVRAGQPIRYPAEAKGRYEPVNVGKWINQRTYCRSLMRLWPTIAVAGTELKKLSASIKCNDALILR